MVVSTWDNRISMSQPRSSALPVWLAVVAFVLGVLGMFASGAAAAVLMSQGFGIGMRPTLLVAELLLVTPALLFVTFGPRLSALRLGGSSRVALFMAVILGCSLWVTSAGLLELQASFFPPSAEFVELFRRIHAALKPDGPFDATLSVLTIAMIPAVCEEILFRGVLLPSLARKMAPVMAVVMSALIFALIHVDGRQFDRVPFAFLMGVALGAIRLRSGSLLPCIVAHATVNTLTFAIAPLLDNPEQAVPPSEPLLGLGLLVVGAIGSVILLKKTRPTAAATLT